MPQQSPIFFPIGTNNVLIIGGKEAMQALRARVLRSQGVHVHATKSITEAASLWVPDFFDLVLVDVRQRSKEAVQFWRTIRRQHPGRRIRFLVGPPTFLSSTCAHEVIAPDEVPEDRVQWQRPPTCCMRPYGLNSQVRTLNQGENSMRPDLLTKTDAAIATHEENVRARAYELYEMRGRIDGHAEDDWLQAEREVAGSSERKAVRASAARSL